MLWAAIKNKVLNELTPFKNCFAKNVSRVYHRRGGALANAAKC